MTDSQGSPLVTHIARPQLLPRQCHQLAPTRSDTRTYSVQLPVMTNVQLTGIGGTRVCAGISRDTSVREEDHPNALEHSGSSGFTKGGKGWEGRLVVRTPTLRCPICGGKAQLHHKLPVWSVP